MDKFIKSDIIQGLQYLKVGIMNALDAIENNEIGEFQFDCPLPLQLVIQCAKERGWSDNMDDKECEWDWTNGWQIDYWYEMKHIDKKLYITISGSLLCGNTNIHVNN